MARRRSNGEAFAAALRASGPEALKEARASLRFTSMPAMGVQSDDQGSEGHALDLAVMTDKQCGGP